MNGQPITAEGEPDIEALRDLEDRLTNRPGRTQVVLVPLEIWLALTGIAVLLGRRRAARIALPLLALSCAYAPLMLLVGAAVQPGESGEALMLGLGSPLLALATTAGFRRSPSGGLAFAAAVTVSAHAIDVVIGSPLTALSVLGPNPGGGVRFFGIGNELEAVLTALTMIGAGAGLTALKVDDPRRAAIWFGAIALLAAAAFAPGRFGADVGAAIVLGVGGATAAALALGLHGRRLLVTMVAVPVLGLIGLVLVDLVLGGGAHLTGSVLGASDSTELSDVIERRVTLTVRSFTHPVYTQLFFAVLVLVAVGAWKRKTVLSWFGARWQARCGFLGALAGIVVGTFANDSGALLLTIGTIFLATAAGFFWATNGYDSGASPGPPPR